MSILLSFTKRVAIRYLEASDDPNLREFAKWIKDAEEQAVNLVVELLGQSFKDNGRIDQSTADQIVAVRNAKEPVAPPYERWRTQLPFLTEYARITATISTLAAWRRAIYLQGFFHSADQSTLWLFEDGKTPSIDIEEGMGGPSSLHFNSAHIKVFFPDAMTTIELQDKNAQIGNNYTAWRESVKNIDELDSVLYVSEDELGIDHWVIGEEQSFRGMVPTKTRVTSKVFIEERSPGIDAMVQSLPAAIEARDKALATVRRKTG
jgi:hypothetical protein